MKYKIRAGSIADTFITYILPIIGIVGLMAIMSLLTGPMYR